MKRLCIITVTVLALLLCGCQDSNNGSGGGYSVDWKDPALEQVVRDYLDLTGDETVRSTDLRQIKLLSIYNGRIRINNGDDIPLPEGMQVEQLDDLVHFKNLSSLTLAGSQIEDLSAVAFLMELQRIILFDNPNITDISPAEDLPKLVGFIAYNNKSLTDFTPVGGMEGLADLDLHRCSLRNLDFFGSKPKLKKLKLQGNYIVDISPLADCPNLQQVDLQSNNVSDLTPLSDLDKLTKLELTDNRISDLSPLSGLSKLSVLRVTHNRVTDAAPLAELTGLTVLGLDRNDIGDLAPLENLQKLKALNLSRNERITAQDVAALREQLPEQCEITWP